MNSPLRENDVYNEQHAVVALDRYASFSLPWYDTADKQASVAYQGMAMVSVLNVVSQTHWSLLPRVGWRKSSLNSLICKFCHYRSSLIAVLVTFHGMKQLAGIKGISGWKSCLSASAVDKCVRINHINACGLS